MSIQKCIENQLDFDQNKQKKTLDSNLQKKKKKHINVIYNIYWQNDQEKW